MNQQGPEAPTHLEVIATIRLKAWPPTSDNPATKGCGKPLKSADTRLNHEKICKGVQATREELQIEKTALQAQLTNQVETSNQHMAVASSASVSAVKAVCDIMSKPHKMTPASLQSTNQ
ncbi:TPA: hypothetical protein ACH3X1_014333 [Trebouxia sp. C0004]